MTAFKTLLDTVGGRKYFIVLVMVLGIAVCTAFGITIAATHLDFLKWVIGMYFSANVGKDSLSWLINRGKTVDPKALTDVDAIVAAMMDMASQLPASDSDKLLAALASVADKLKSKKAAS